jgi:hypothetical protein
MQSQEHPALRAGDAKLAQMGISDPLKQPESASQRPKCRVRLAIKPTGGEWGIKLGGMCSNHGIFS